MRNDTEEANSTKTNIRITEKLNTLTVLAYVALMSARALLILASVFVQ